MTSKRSFILLIVSTKFRNVLWLQLLFLEAKAMLNNFHAFEELVLFDLWIPHSGLRFQDSGFRIPDSGFQFRFRNPDSAFQILELPVYEARRNNLLLKTCIADVCGSKLLVYVCKLCEARDHVLTVKLKFLVDHLSFDFKIPQLS